MGRYINMGTGMVVGNNGMDSNIGGFVESTQSKEVLGLDQTIDNSLFMTYGDGDSSAILAEGIQDIELTPIDGLPTPPAYAEISDGNLVITGSEGDDDIEVSQDGDVVTVTINGETTSYTGVKTISINSGDGADTITISEDVTITNLDAGDGDDTIFNDMGTIKNLNAGDGDDIIVNNGEIRNLDAGDGDDTIFNFEGEIRNLNAGDGDDEIFNASGEIRNLDAGDGDDTITNFEGEIRNLNAGDGDDTITNVYGEIRNLDAGDGDDEIFNDWGGIRNLDAGDGDDTITNSGTIRNLDGGEGTDVLNHEDGSYVGLTSNIEEISENAKFGIDYPLFEIDDPTLDVFVDPTIETPVLEEATV